MKNTAYDDYLKVAKLITQSYISLVLFVLPLILTNAYYNITETKLFTFYVLSFAYIGIQLFLFLFFLFSKRKEFLKSLNIKLNFIDITFLGFGFSCVISGFFSQFEINDVVFGIGSRYQGVLTILVYVTVYFVLTRTFSFSPACLVWAGIGFSVVCVIAVLNGFSIDPLGFYLELTETNKERYISTIGNINFFSAYCNLLLPVFVVGFCKAIDKKTAAVFGAFVVIGSVGMVFTASESFLLGFLPAMLITFALLMTDEKSVKRLVATSFLFIFSIVSYTKLYESSLLKDTLHFEPSALMSLVSDPIIVGVLVVFLVVVFIIAGKKPELLPKVKKVYCALLILGLVSGLFGITLVNTAFNDVDLGELNQYLKFSDNWGTNRGRNWAFCIKLFFDAPLLQKLFGFGPETYYHFTEEAGFYKYLSLDQAHNEYLQYLISVGVFGLASYIGIIIGTVKKCAGKLSANAVAMSILCGLVAYWIQAIVNIAQPFTTPIMFVFVAALANLSAVKSIETEK